MGVVCGLGCVVCRRLGYGYVPAEFHHIAPGSAPRSDYSGAPLCPTHHDEQRAGTGFHGMGEKRFCKLFRVPFECELGLLVWVNEDLAKIGMGALPL